MRLVLGPVALVVVVVLGSVQFVSALALREYAVAGSWVRLVPEGVALRVERVDPAWPMPPALRAVLARRALDEGDGDRAAALIARLGASSDKHVLEGRVAQARGDSAAANRAYLAADDLEDLDSNVSRLRSARAYGKAIDLQQALIAHLALDRTERDTLAQAYYVLGDTEEEAAYLYLLYSADRTAHEERAAAAYEHALEIAPAEERYLLAYANQLLNLERYADARAWFDKAHDADVTRPEPYVGLGEAALRLGNRTEALAQFARARKIDPNNDAVVRFARELGS